MSAAESDFAKFSSSYPHSIRLDCFSLEQRWVYAGLRTLGMTSLSGPVVAWSRLNKENQDRISAEHGTIWVADFGGGACESHRSGIVSRFLSLASMAAKVSGKDVYTSFASHGQIDRPVWALVKSDEPATYPSICFVWGRQYVPVTPMEDGVITGNQEELVLRHRKDFDVLSAICNCQAVTIDNRMDDSLRNWIVSHYKSWTGWTWYPSVYPPTEMAPSSHELPCAALSVPEAIPAPVQPTPEAEPAPPPSDRPDQVFQKLLLKFNPTASIHFNLGLLELIDVELSDGQRETLWQALLSLLGQTGELEALKVLVPKLRQFK